MASDRQALINVEDDVHMVGASGPGPSEQAPPAYSEINENKPSNGTTPTAPPAGNLTIGQDELPPPYTPNAVTLFINCRVCQNPISLEGRQHLQVIKCGSCNEATPIKNAPAGKKYIRCPCNCLLICNIGAARVACPRANCRRMISLTVSIGNGMQAALVTPPGRTIRANCGHCNQVFVFLRSNVKHKLAICPHCSGRSSVGNGFIKRRALLFGLIGLFFLILGIGTTLVSVLTVSGVGVYVVWIGAYVAGALNILRALLYCCVKVSPPIN